MKVSLYAVNDALNGFGPIALQNNDASAMRAFEETFKSVHSPQDYSLWKIGSYDTETGMVESMVPEIICRGTDFNNKEITNE